MRYMFNPLSFSHLFFNRSVHIRQTLLTHSQERLHHPSQSEKVILRKSTRAHTHTHSFVVCTHLKYISIIKATRYDHRTLDGDPSVMHTSCHRME